jgi:AGZA family xanthine/uracil permease-like MFS transporter
VPGLAAWALVAIETSLRAVGSSLFEAASKVGSALYLEGAIALSQGFLLTSMVLAAMLVFAIDRRFLRAAAWALAAAALSMTGLIHAYELTPEGVANHFGLAAAPGFGAMYGLAAVLLVGLHFYGRRASDEPPSVAAKAGRDE